MALNARCKQGNASIKSHPNMTKTKKPEVGAKEAISTFCLFLHQCGALKLSPEDFRQAKFDRKEAVLPMWELLHQLTVFAVNGQFPKQKLTKDRGDDVNNIKYIMWWYGYRCMDFFNLPSDMTSGSQEVLLACGWFMAQSSLISRLMELNRVPFIGSDTAFLHKQEVETNMRKASNKQCPTTRKSLSPSGQVKHLAWMAGRCKMALRGLYMRQQELCNLTHQIHVATQGVSISSDVQHLSVLETFLLRHPCHMQKYQDMLHAEVLRLQTCVKWSEHQHVFWQWMESVLDVKLSNGRKQHVETTLDSGSPSANTSMQPQMREVQQASAELSGIIAQIEAKLRDLPDLPLHKQVSEEIELIKKDILKDVEVELASVTRVSYKNRPIRLQYVSTVGEGSEHSTLNKDIGGRLFIKDEISRLESVLQDMNLQHRQLQKKCRHDMAAITDRLIGMVCIPPMGQIK